MQALGVTAFCGADLPWQSAQPTGAHAVAVGERLASDGVRRRQGSRGDEKHGEETGRHHGAFR